MTSGNVDRVPWAALTPTVLVPNLLQGTGQGVVLPLIPITALALGASYSTAVLVGAMFTAGQLAVTLPAGWFLNRYGEKTAMLTSSCVAGVAASAAFAAPTVLALGGAVFGIGVGIQALVMARHAWVTVAVPLSVRGRSLSLIGGSSRIGALLGPFVAAGTLAVFDHVRVGFLVLALTSVVTLLLVASTAYPSDARGGADEPQPRVFATMWERRSVLLRLGLTTSLVSTLRATRQILVPLVGIALGFGKVEVALIVGIAAGVEVSLFYVGGVVVDRLGRLWVAVPGLATFGLCHALLGLSLDLPAGRTWYLAATMAMAVANGLCSGLVATLGSDLADDQNPAAFLSSWRLVVELGPAVAPFAVGLVAAASLGTAAVSMGALGLAGAALLPRYVRRYLPSPAKVPAGAGRTPT